jgi:hypothetical protein
MVQSPNVEEVELLHLGILNGLAGQFAFINRGGIYRIFPGKSNPGLL